MADETKKLQGDKDEATNQATDRLAEMRGEHPPEEVPAPQQGRPTPTQDELDRIRRGENVVLSPDGSPQDFRSTPADQLTDRHKHKYGLSKASEDDVADKLRKEGWKRVPEEDDKKKSSGPEGGAPYKTRESTVERPRGSSHKKKDD